MQPTAFHDAPSTVQRRLALLGAATMSDLLTLVACGATPRTQASEHPPATESPAILTKTLTLATLVRSKTSVPPPPTKASVAAPNAVAFPQLRETAIGFESRQAQTRHSDDNWSRWTRQRRGKPLHHRPAGLDPECQPVTLRGHEYRVNGPTAATSFAVSCDRNVIYRGSLPDLWASPPIFTVATWQDSWVVEVSDELIVNGESFNQKIGYNRAFNWVLWRDQPLYFYEQLRVVQVSYAGIVLPDAYDAVAHNLCCSDAMQNIINCREEISFYAKRGPKWYDVEMTFPSAVR